MTKNEFLAFLDGVMATFDDAPNDPYGHIIKRIIEKAEELEEPVQSVPYTPVEPSNPYDTWPYKPWEPTIWWSQPTSASDIKIDSTIPDPNDWSIEVNTPGPPNFKVVK